MKPILGLFLTIALTAFAPSTGFAAGNPFRGLWDRCLQALSRENPLKGQEFIRVPSLLVSGPADGKDVVCKIVATDRSGVTVDLPYLSNDFTPVRKRIALKDLRPFKSTLAPPSIEEALARRLEMTAVDVGVPEVPAYLEGPEGQLRPAVIESVRRAAQLVHLSQAKIENVLEQAGIPVPARQFRVALRPGLDSVGWAGVRPTIVLAKVRSHPDYLAQDFFIGVGLNALSETVLAHEVSHQFDPSGEFANQRYLSIAAPMFVGYDLLRETWADYLTFVSTDKALIAMEDGKPIRDIGKKPGRTYFSWLGTRPLEFYENFVPIHEESVYFSHLLFALGEKYGHRNVLKAFHDLRAKQYSDLTPADGNVPFPRLGKAEAEIAAQQGIILARYLLRWIRTEHPEWAPDAEALFREYGL